VAGGEKRAMSERAPVSIDRALKHSDRQEVLQKAHEWYRQQMDTFKMCHGNDWPANREWVSAYVLEQLRIRLLERGWRVKL
jgi:hypothetical protein